MADDGIAVRRGDRGIPLGRLRGIRLVVTPSWFLSVAVIVVVAAPLVRRFVPGTSGAGSALIAVLLAVLLGLSVLAHELGHCAAALRLGIPVREVRLYLIGGSSELARSPASAKEESLIAAAGPAVSVLLTLACWAAFQLMSAGSIGYLVTLELALANGIVAVFNILPALPLDGGRVLRALVWRITGRYRGGTIAGVIGGFALAAALLVWAALTLGAQTRTGTLQAVIIAVMGFFVATGAWAEWPSASGGHRSPSQLLRAVTRPVVRAREGEMAGSQTAGSSYPAVRLVIGSDGRTLGVLDLAGSNADPAAIIPLRPEMMVLPGDPPGEVIARIAALSLPLVALLDQDGQVSGVVMATDLHHASATRAPRR